MQEKHSEMGDLLKGSEPRVCGSPGIKCLVSSLPAGGGERTVVCSPGQGPTLWPDFLGL